MTDVDIIPYKVGEEVEVPGTEGNLFKKVITPGAGPLPAALGTKMKVHYVGTLAKGGKEFDSSRKKDQFFHFTLGVQEVIKAWDIGMATMRKGERSVLRCSPEYGYGARGYPPAIPPNSMLCFDVEVFDWEEPKDQLAAFVPLLKKHPQTRSLDTFTTMRWVMSIAGLNRNQLLQVETAPGKARDLLKQLGDPAKSKPLLDRFATKLHSHLTTKSFAETDYCHIAVVTLVFGEASCRLDHRWLYCRFRHAPETLIKVSMWREDLPEGNTKLELMPLTATDVSVDDRSAFVDPLVKWTLQAHGGKWIEQKSAFWEAAGVEATSTDAIADLTPSPCPVDAMTPYFTFSVFAIDAASARHGQDQAEFLRYSK